MPPAAATASVTWLLNGSVYLPGVFTLPRTITVNRPSLTTPTETMGARKYFSNARFNDAEACAGVSPPMAIRPIIGYWIVESGNTVTVCESAGSP